MQLCHIISKLIIHEKLLQLKIFNMKCRSFPNLVILATRSRSTMTRSPLSSRPSFPKDEEQTTKTCARFGVQPSVKQ